MNTLAKNMNRYTKDPLQRALKTWLVLVLAFAPLAFTGDEALAAPGGSGGPGSGTVGYGGDGGRSGQAGDDGENGAPGGSAGSPGSGGSPIGSNGSAGAHGDNYGTGCEGGGCGGGGGGGGGGTALTLFGQGHSQPSGQIRGGDGGDGGHTYFGGGGGGGAGGHGVVLAHPFQLTVGGPGQIAVVRGGNGGSRGVSMDPLPGHPGNGGYGVRMLAAGVTLNHPGSQILGGNQGNHTGTSAVQGIGGDGIDSHALGRVDNFGIIRGGGGTAPGAGIRGRNGLIVNHHGGLIAAGELSSGSGTRRAIVFHDGGNRLNLRARGVQIDGLVVSQDGDDELALQWATPPSGSPITEFDISRIGDNSQFRGFDRFLVIEPPSTASTPLALAGDINQPGTSWVLEHGDVLVEGDMDGATIEVRAGVVLGGTGTAGTIVLQDGATLEPGNHENPAEALVLTGHYQPESGGTLRLRGPMGHQPRLLVNGTASLAGHLQISDPDLVAGYFPMLTTVGIDGDFDTLTFDPPLPSGLDGEIHDDNGRLSLLVRGSDQFLILPSTEGNGAISPELGQVVDAGQSFDFTLQPDEFHHLEEVTGSCGGNLDGMVFTTAPASQDCTVTAHFTVDTYTVTAVSTGHGSVNPADQTVPHGQDAMLKIMPAEGWHTETVAGDTCQPVQDEETQWQIESVSADCQVTAEFAINTYEISSQVASGQGTVSPGTQSVSHGNDAVLTVNPESGWRVAAVTGDNCEPMNDGGAVWRISGVTSDCAVSAHFEPDPEDELFQDRFQHLASH